MTTIVIATGGFEKVGELSHGRAHLLNFDSTWKFCQLPPAVKVPERQQDSHSTVNSQHFFSFDKSIVALE